MGSEMCIRDRVVPVDVSAFLLNEKRSDINEIESRSGVRIVVVASPYLDTPHFEVRRLRDDEIDQSRRLSFDIDLPSAAEPSTDSATETPVSAPEALVRGVTPDAPAPEAPSEKAQAPQQKKKPQRRHDAQKRRNKQPEPTGLLAKLWAALFGGGNDTPSDEKSQAREGKTGQSRRRSRNRSGDRQRDDRSKSEGNRQRDRGDRDRRGNGRRRKPENSESPASEQPESGQQSGLEQSENAEQPKRSRRRRGRRGGQRHSDGATNQTSETASTNESDDAAVETDQSNHRRRPAEKRNEGRRRRQRQSVEVDSEVTSAQPTASIDYEVSDNHQAATEALAEPVEIASSEALSAAFAESESSTPSEQIVEEQTQTELHPSSVVAAIETAKTEAAKTMVTETAHESDESEGDDGSVLDQPAAQPALGITAAGRAVNDPRISPKPITDTPVTTEQGPLFWQPEAPPVTVVERDVQRASNDPRGPRATGS